MYWITVKIGVKMGPHMDSCSECLLYWTSFSSVVCSSWLWPIASFLIEICGSTICLCCCTVTVKCALMLSVPVMTEGPESCLRMALICDDKPYSEQRGQTQDSHGGGLKSGEQVPWVQHKHRATAELYFMADRTVVLEFSEPKSLS